MSAFIPPKGRWRCIECGHWRAAGFGHAPTCSRGLCVAASDLGRSPAPGCARGAIATEGRDERVRELSAGELCAEHRELAGEFWLTCLAVFSWRPVLREPADERGVDLRGRRAVGKTKLKYELGVESEMTFWASLAEALEVAVRLGWPRCGPKCIAGLHLVVWKAGDRCRVLDLTRLDLDPRKRRGFPTVSTNRKSSREAHEARTVEKLMVAGHFDLAAA